MKILDRILTVIGYILAIVPYMIIGAYCVYAADKLYPDDSIGENLIMMGLLLLVAVFTFFVHIIAHEFGHYVFGKASGWNFASFRVGSFTLVKQDGKTVIRKTTVAGTGGQCLMSPPEDCEYEDCPFTMYLLGGGLINIILGGISLLGASFLSGLPQVVFTIGAITGIGLGVMNLFPAKMSGTANDGYNIFFDLPKNKEAKKAMACLMDANARLYGIESTKQLPEKLRKTIIDFDYSDITNIGICNLLFYKATLLMEDGKYDEVKEIYQRVNDTPEALLIFRSEAKCELLYFEIMGNCDKEKIEALYDKKLAEYIKATSLYPSRRRLMYAYYLIYKKDEAKAKEEYDALLKTAETHPSKAEGAIEIKEAERVKARYDNTGSEQKAD